jgi:hypothetical protein
MIGVVWIAEAGFLCEAADFSHLRKIERAVSR